VEAIDSQSFFRDATNAFDDVAICVRRNKAAKMLALSVSTLDRLVKAGELTCLKLPGCVLFRVDTLRAWASDKESRDDAGGKASASQTNTNSKPTTQGD